MNQSRPATKRYSPKAIIIIVVVTAVSAVVAAIIVDRLLSAHTWIRALVPAVALLVTLPLVRKWEARNTSGKDDEKPAS